MPYSTLPTVTTGNAIKATAWGNVVRSNFEDHETRLLDLEAATVGSGDVVGPASATDNAIARFDATTGKLIQNSGITIADGASGSLSGTNTGDQSFTGDVTGSGGGAVAMTIATAAVTYAKMQDVSAASRLLGRGSSGSGDVEEITLGNGLAMSGTTISVTAEGGVPALDDITDVTITTPSTNQVLTYNGTIWVNQTPASASTAQFVTLATDATLTNERVLTGTANQITITDNGAGSTVVLSTPQNLHTSATPQFARMGLGVAADANAVLKMTGHYVSTTHDKGNSGTSLTINWNDGNTQLVTLTGNCTFTFSNPLDGGRYLLALEQDGTGSRTVTWPASVKWSAGTAPTLSTTAGKVDIITFVFLSGIGASGNYLGAANTDYTPA